MLFDPDPDFQGSAIPVWPRFSQMHGHSYLQR